MIEDNNLNYKEKETLFVQVALPLPLETFTYRVPFQLNDKIKLGQMVAVRFGRKIKKLYGGVVLHISTEVPQGFQAAYIEEIVDEIPIINEYQLRFWKWLASYYMSNLGDVMIAALPAGLRVNGETRIFSSNNPDIGDGPLDENEIKILAALEQNAYLTIDKVQKIFDLPYPLKYIKSLYEKGLIKVADEITKNYKPKRVAMVRLHENAQDETLLRAYITQMEKRSAKQLQVLLYLLQNQGEPIEKRKLLNQTGASAAVIKSLEEKFIVSQYYKEESRLKAFTGELEQFTLSSEQTEAVAAIEKGFEEKKPVLLFGPTASGKTYVYLSLIKKALDEGKQVLYLLPEIALTEQMIQKLSTFLGDEVLVTHSKYSQNERAEAWDLLRSKAVNVIVGPRSAIFSPFFDLGLIIVDEEHENSFKQTDKSPRFNGRDAAIMLAKFSDADIILGSATPSVESMYAAKQNKYQLVELATKFDQAGSIEFTEVSLTEAKEKNKLKSMFTFEMIDEIKNTIADGKQAIIFHNRKGFVPITTCASCGWIPHCVNCDIALTYYKYNQEMRCHYCGFKTKPPTNCQDCGSTSLVIEGYGTEKITEDLKAILPDVGIERFDQESTRKKKAHKELIDGFAAGNIKILVGTQLLAKGFDFESVDFVGVVNADHMLYFPDFRSGERTFQLITQVAGRTGRRDRVGKVMLQTHRSNHPIIHAIMEHDYYKMYQTELDERSKFNYPPFSRLILLQIKSFEAFDAEKAANILGKTLKQTFGERILGPAKPHVSKVKRWHIREILLKINRTTDDLVAIKKAVKKEIDQFYQATDFKKVRITINVDPS